MIIAPSVLSLHYDDFNRELNILNSKCKFLHFDVMDGHFVPNLAFGPDILKTFRRNSNLFLDVHIMVDNPEFISQLLIKNGADSITFHYEALSSNDEIFDLIKKIKQENYVKVGMSIKPGTNVEVLEPFLDYLDIVLIMSVEPGFGGQEFIDSSLDKIRYLKNYKDIHNSKYLIEVDGGINDMTCKKCLDAGVDIVVAGSYLFEGDLSRNIDILENVAK